METPDRNRKLAEFFDIPWGLFETNAAASLALKRVFQQRGGFLETWYRPDGTVYAAAKFPPECFHRVDGTDELLLVAEAIAKACGLEE